MSSNSKSRSESEDALRESQRALLISRNVDKTRDPISAEDDVDQSPRTAICTPSLANAVRTSVRCWHAPRACTCHVNFVSCFSCALLALPSSPEGSCRSILTSLINMYSGYFYFNES